MTAQQTPTLMHDSQPGEKHHRLQRHKQASLQVSFSKQDGENCKRHDISAAHQRAPWSRRAVTHQSSGLTGDQDERLPGPTADPVLCSTQARSHQNWGPAQMLVKHSLLPHPATHRTKSLLGTHSWKHSCRQVWESLAHCAPLSSTTTAYAGACMSHVREMHRMALWTVSRPKSDILLPCCRCDSVRYYWHHGVRKAAPTTANALADSRTPHPPW